jgi:hypothetical protein
VRFGEAAKQALLMQRRNTQKRVLDSVFIYSISGFAAERARLIACDYVNFVTVGAYYTSGLMASKSVRYLGVA